MLSVVVYLAIFASPVLCSIGGAPSSACDDRFPDHYSLERWQEPPYDVTVEVLVPGDSYRGIYTTFKGCLREKTDIDPMFILPLKRRIIFA